MSAPLSRMNEKAEPYFYAHMVGAAWTVATSRAMEIATGEPPTFQSYLLTLEGLTGRERADTQAVALYGSVYDDMMLSVIRTVPACVAVWALSLALTGARKVQMGMIVPVRDGDTINYHVPGVKGGASYDISARMEGNLLGWMVANLEKYRTAYPDSYIRYALIRSGYRYFGKPVATHHGLTHMFRYYFVQVLMYVLDMPDDAIARTIGVLDIKNIAYYADPVVFRI